MPRESRPEVAGFAVLFPMPRGGAGYGEAGQRAISDLADQYFLSDGADFMAEYFRRP